MVKLKNKILVIALTLVIALGVFAGLCFNKNSMSVYASGDSKTVADILPSDFPTAIETGWISSDCNNVAYIYNANNTLRFEKVNDSTTFYPLSLNSDVELVSGNYSCHISNPDCTCTFVMKDNKLSSIEFNSSFRDTLNGTYTNPPEMLVEIDDTDAGSVIAVERDANGLKINSINGGTIDLYEPDPTSGNLIEIHFSKTSGGDGYAETKFSINQGYKFVRLSYTLDGTNYIDVDSFSEYDEEIEKNYITISGITSCFNLKIVTEKLITISEILPSDFPTTQANVWKSEEGGICYLASSDSLMFSKVGSLIVETTWFVKVSGTDYRYTSLGGYSVTFNMENDKLISITFDTANTDLAYLKGQYKQVQLIEKPTADTTNFVYDGTEKTYQLEENDAYTISDNTTQTEVGTYTITVSLINKFQYKWADGKTNDLTYTFVINQKAEQIAVKDETGATIQNPPVSIIEANGGIAPDAVFVVKTIPNTNTESINNTENILRENNKLEKQEVVAVYDAKLLVNNVEVQPNGIIKIKMLVPEEVKGESFKLYHIHNGTEVIEVDYTAVDENGYITFETDKLSEFAFATDIKDTGLSAGAIVGIVLGSLVGLAIIAYVLGYFFLYRKGKLDDKKIKVIYRFLPKSENNLRKNTKTK